ncbi:MAG: nitroreductase family protein [Methanobrevibacter sp.]|nr:nitroreductase family protein [Methanobrevibacter sp.]
MNFIFKRASVREFSDKELNISKVENLIKAGMQAPSACNSQPWEFLIVVDEDDKKAVSEMSPYAKPAAKAQKLIITMANSDKFKKTKTDKWFPQDLSACTENILLQATIEGIGSVWLGFYPSEERVKKLKEYFGIPENVIPFSVIALGYPKEKPVPRKNFKAEKIHVGRY